MHCILGCSALHPGFQCTASALAVHCVQNNLRCTYLQGQMLNEGFSRKRLRERLQTFAGAVANVCGDGCNALRLRGAKLELKSSVLFWMREKTAP